MQDTMRTEIQKRIAPELKIIFVLPLIHIRQIGEVRTIIHTAIMQNYTKLPNRIQVLD